MAGETGNLFNYVEQFRTQLEQKYSRELVSGDLTSNGITFIGTKTVKIPRLTVAGYKEHSRAGGWNRQDLANDFEIKALAHDRDVEFYVDAMDVDETNQIVSAGNITNTFEEEQAIPELDAYRFSKLYYDYTTTFSKVADTTALTTKTVLTVFDQFMEDMDDKGVPQSGRILYVTAQVHTLLKNAEHVQRMLTVNGSNDGSIRRIVRSLDDVKIVTVPKDRFKTVYDFSDGFVADDTALQINMMLIHPRSVIAVDKHSAIYLWPPGSHQTGDGYLYQNRRYGDLFLIERKLDGVKINVTAAEEPVVVPPVPDTEVAIVSAVQDGGTTTSVDSTGIKITFDVDVVGLTADHITLAAGTGSATKGTLTGSAKVWTLAITDPTEGDVTILIAGLEGYSFPEEATTVGIFAEP